MADIYSNFQELANNEIAGADYKIDLSVSAFSKVLVSAIHGGGIEPGTSELAHYIGHKNNHSCYSFDGIKSSGNTSLHITSTNFNEPTALKMNSMMYHSVFLHGYEGTEKNTYLGGMDFEMMDIIRDELMKSGFNVVENAPVGINGNDPDNICNKNLRGKGVQLEISTAQRQAFFKNNDFSSANRENPVQEFYDYANALDRAIRLGHEIAAIRNLAAEK